MNQSIVYFRFIRFANPELTIAPTIADIALPKTVKAFSGQFASALVQMPKKAIMIIANVKKISPNIANI